jgi:predicted Fe-Mo cluster-binding NifX family protein
VTASVSPETLTVVQNIIQRYKEKHSVFFTHIEIQIMFFWHTYQALTGELMDPALPMMITGVLTPYATDMELHNQATEKLRSERDSADQARTSDLNEMVRLLAANGAEVRIWETLTQGTMFYFKASNIAVAQIPSTSTSTFTSPVTETSNEISIQTAQSPAACEEASPTPDMTVVETSQTETRLEQLEEENFLLTEKVYCLEDERAQFQEEWENMARKLKESEAENQRLRSVLEASLQIFAEPWESLKDKYGN